MTLSSQCAERSGFLFKHRCDRMVHRDCQQCGKKICQHHTVATSLASNSVLVCTSCAKRTDSRLSDSGDYAAPCYYGHSHYHGWGRDNYSHSSNPPAVPADPSTPPPLPGMVSAEAPAYDPNDLTEADGEATEVPGDEGFETDMEGS